MQDKTIDNALLALRKQIIRGDLDGLDHVEALLTARGVRLPRVLRPWRANQARAHEVRLIVLKALQRRPMRLAELAQIIADKRGETYGQPLRNRTAQCLYKMKLAGMVVRERRLWAKSDHFDAQWPIWLPNRYLGTKYGFNNNE